ncbi:pyroglutamyl-peptidase I [Salirhabdus salicampi]|uniref:pyroglutamyl-peptidase I n=1 Tax=Salirhabdus salicampi TaxID=476102 RepID=UPI0020C54B43|nr:pyroglutamyl-peptidase I [Salirhabdus salicampi]MCP8617836.1 pyroglutamyl-peptidase I [Salirhabdus salicampi]
MKVLVSGFEPFGEMNINPTQQLVEKIAEVEFEGVDVKTVLLPVNYDECVEKITKKIEKVNPDIVISCGLFAGRTAITPERIGINVKDTMAEDPIPDNKGTKPVDVPVVKNGPDGLFSTIPNRQIVEQLQQEAIPAFISNTAGTYICNNTLYGVLHYIQTNKLKVKAGFVHFPASTEMGIEKPTLPTLPMETMIKGLEVIIRTCIK